MKSARGLWRSISMPCAALLVLSGCGDLGSGCGIPARSPAPLMPVGQTIEGGVQVRLTPSGFAKVTSVLPGLLNGELGSGFCLPHFNISGSDFCAGTDGACAPGCHVGVSLGSASLSAPTTQTLRLALSISLDANLAVHEPVGTDCVLGVSATGVSMEADVDLLIDPSTGELSPNVRVIPPDVSSRLGWSGCPDLASQLPSIVPNIGDMLAGLLATALSPPLNAFLGAVIPAPTREVLDLASLAAPTTGSQAADLEHRSALGGYANLSGGGLSLGVITGVNADVDPTTRTPGLASEPALCVPARTPPDLASAPYSLATTPRGTFTLPPSGLFAGAPDPAADLAIGISRASLDLFAYHAYASGALCRNIGPDRLPTLGTLAPMLPSLVDLGLLGPNDPIEVVLRPEEPFALVLGDGTAASPYLSVHVSNLDIDVYAVAFERSIRLYTLETSFDAGINLEVSADPSGAVLLTASLASFDARSAAVRITHAELLREDPGTLQASGQALLAALLPWVIDQLPGYTLPGIAGGALTNVALTRQSEPSGDWLVLSATLGPAAGLAPSSAPVPRRAAHTRARSLPAAGACSVGHGGGLAGALLLLLTLVLLRSRRATVALLALAVNLACGGGDVASDAAGSSEGGAACSANADCHCAAGLVAGCTQGACVCNADLAPGNIGQYSALALAADGTAWISAYDATYGDLVVASMSGAGRVPIASWERVDGVPQGPVEVPGSSVRGGVRAPGPDVGLFTDIAVSPSGNVYVSYFDVDTRSLRAAVRAGGSWSVHVVDAGQPLAGSSFEIAGRYSALVLRLDDGRPAIAYLAIVSDASGARSEIRLASAATATPASSADWSIVVAQSRPIAGALDPSDLRSMPPGTGLFVDAVRHADQSVTLLYYDHDHGDLVRADGDTGGFGVPAIIAGASDDVGQHLSATLDSSGELHAAFIDATHARLCHWSAASAIEIVDDGYRIDGMTADGVPSPVYHRVGADASLSMASTGLVVAYQDSTSFELLVTSHDASGTWTRGRLAGGATPFAGGYGLFTSAAYDGAHLVVSSWVVDAPHAASWVEVFRQP